MIITFKGDNYFAIQSGETSILIDPNNQRSFKGSTIVISTLKPGLVEPIEASGPFYISNSGEYEVAGIHIRGYSTGLRKFDGKNRENTAYLINFDSISIGILGHYTTNSKNEALEHISGCDVLILPAGNTDLISASDAAKLVRQLEPAVIIPSFSKNLPAFGKEMDADLNFEERFTFKKKDLAENAMAVHFLKP